MDQSDSVKFWLFFERRCSYTYQACPSVRGIRGEFFFHDEYGLLGCLCEEIDAKYRVWQ